MVQRTWCIIKICAKIRTLLEDSQPQILRRVICPSGLAVKFSEFFLHRGTHFWAVIPNSMVLEYLTLPDSSELSWQHCWHSNKRSKISTKLKNKFRGEILLIQSSAKGCNKANRCSFDDDYISWRDGRLSRWRWWNGIEFAGWKKVELKSHTLPEESHQANVRGE